MNKLLINKVLRIITILYWWTLALIMLLTKAGRWQSIWLICNTIWEHTVFNLSCRFSTQSLLRIRFICCYSCPWCAWGWWALWPICSTKQEHPKFNLICNFNPETFQQYLCATHPTNIKSHIIYPVNKPCVKMRPGSDIRPLLHTKERI